MYKITHANVKQNASFKTQWTQRGHLGSEGQGHSLANFDVLRRWHVKNMHTCTEYERCTVVQTKKNWQSSLVCGYIHTSWQTWNSAVVFITTKHTAFSYFLHMQMVNIYFVIYNPNLIYRWPQINLITFNQTIVILSSVKWRCFTIIYYLKYKIVFICSRCI